MGITRGSDGNLWITYNDPDNGNPQIARLTPPQSPVYLTPDRASTIALGLTPARIPADGRTSSLATATLTNAGGSLVTGECVVFTSNGKQAIGSVTRNADGTDSARISSTTTPGTALISVTDVSVTPHISASAMLTQVGPASALRLTLTPPVLVADGKAAGTVTATVNDINGNGVSGEHVSFTSDGGQPIGSVADHGDGTYTATVTATTRAGTSTMTATDSTATSLTATAALRQIAGPASALSLTLQPAALIADGVSTSVLVATIHDTNGNAVPGDRVKFSSDGGQHIGPVTDNQDGTYSTTLTATARAGISTITATDGAVTPSLTGTAVLRQTAAPAAVLSVTVQPTSIVADGKATSVATAAIQDANGNSVAGETVTFRSDGGQHVGPVTDNHDGTYSAVVTATTTAGSASIVATDTATMPNLVGAATLRQVAGPPSVLVLTLQPASIVADGNATSVATATIRDPNGNGIAGQTIQITSDGGQRIGRVTDNGDGTYRATISATTMAGSSSITATDTTPSPSLTGSVTLVQTAEPATLVIITVTPTTPTVGLGSTVQFTASATYSHGPVKDVTGSARWTSSDPGVASVSAGGKASALAVGHTTITATFASVSGAATLQVVNTPAGTGVVVSPVDAATGLHPVTLTFASVAAPGTTSLTISNAGAAPPQGFALGNPATYLDLHTTATFSGAVSICVDYGDSTTFGTKDPKLFHMVGGSWHDITTSLDLSHHVVCGSTTSLSPFAAFAPSAPENSSGSGQPIVLAPTGGPPVNLFLGLLSVLTGCAVMLGRRRSSVKGP